MNTESVITSDYGFGERISGLATLRRNWKWILLRGILSLFLGICAFLFPVTALFAFTMVFATYAGIDGVLALVSAVRGVRHKRERWWVYVIRGVVGIATALLFAIAPIAMTLSYAFLTLNLLAIWAILTGALEVYAAVRLREIITGEWLMALSGILSVALGLATVAMLVVNPLATLPTAAWVIGTYALIAGVVLVSLGFRLRRA